MVTTLVRTKSTKYPEIKVITHLTCSYYDFSFHKQNMKRFVMLLVTLAVANSFPLENEENAALKTKVIYYHKSFVCFR